MSAEFAIPRPNRQGQTTIATGPRVAAFLAALRKCGTFRGAARAVASPEQLSEPGHDCASAWHSLRRRDPIFAAAVDDAMGAFLDDLHERARAIAMGEVCRPARYEGRTIGMDPIVDTGSVNLLLRLLERHDSNWAQHKKYEHLIHHDQNGGEPGLLIRVSEFQQLSSQHQEQLKAIIVELRGLRAQQVAEAPALIEHDEGDGLSAEDQQILAEITSHDR